MKAIKNILLMLTPLISQLRVFFYQSKERVDWWLLYDYTNTNGDIIGVPIYWAVYFYTTAINFLILSYCLFRPDGINEKLKELIYTICLLDVFHLIIYAGKSFIFTKIFIAFVIIIIKDILSKNKWRKQNIY